MNRTADRSFNMTRKLAKTCRARGHERTPDNLTASGGCIECGRIRSRLAYHANGKTKPHSPVCRNCGHTRVKHDGGREECWYRRRGVAVCECVKFEAVEVKA